MVNLRSRSAADVAATNGAITTASNGLTKVGSDVKLGGTLSENTSLVTGAFDLNVDANTLVVDGSANRVGIGTATPRAAFDNVGESYLGNTFVDGSGNMEINIEGSGDRNAYLDFWADDTNTDYSARLIRAPGVNGELRLRNKGTGLIALGTNNSDDMVIADGGDVGIGTSAPTAKLDVRGSAVFNDGSIDADFRIESNNNTNAFQINGGTDDVIVNGDGSSLTDFRVEGGTDENMLFVDASADRVGIGTNLPTATLDVNPGRVEFQGVGATDASGVHRYGHSRNWKWSKARRQRTNYEHGRDLAYK